MRRGFTITELLIITITLPVMAIVLDGLYGTLVRDIPRSSRVVQENTTLLNMLGQMQDDIDRAKGLPDGFAGHTASEKLLLIEMADGMICYELKDGRVLRRNLRGPGQEADDETRVWSVPNAEAKWRVWRRDGAGYAVEVKAYIKQKLRDRFQKKMANSHLYFVGAL